MIEMDLLSVIRRWRFRDKLPIREIGRRTGLARNTVRKYLRSDTVELRFKVPDRPSKLDPYADKLSGWLRIEADKSRKQRRTVTQMHADLMELGFEGSYGRVAAFVRKWKAQLQHEQQTSGAAARHSRLPRCRARHSPLRACPSCAADHRAWLAG